MKRLTGGLGGQHSHLGSWQELESQTIPILIFWLCWKLCRERQRQKEWHDETDRTAYHDAGRQQRWTRYSHTVHKDTQYKQAWAYTNPLYTKHQISMNNVSLDVRAADCSRSPDKWETEMRVQTHTHQKNYKLINIYKHIPKTFIHINMFTQQHLPLTRSEIWG